MNTATKRANNLITNKWEGLAARHRLIKAVIDRHCGLSLTYGELYRLILNFASGLQALGLKKNDKISLFSENSAKWLIADQAVFMCGGINAVRGSQTPKEELLYILEHSDSSALIADNLDTIKKIHGYPLQFIICLSDEEISDELSNSHNIYSFDKVVSIGEKQKLSHVDIDENDIATIVYTSGTTGKPKGVMLSHGNFLSQIEAFNEILPMSAAQTCLNILPTWHVYERTCEYFLLSKGITMAYTSVTGFKDDIKRYNPHYLVLVPRIWESIYSAVQFELKKQPLLKQKILNLLLKAGELHIKTRRTVRNLNIEPGNNPIKSLFTYYLTLPIYKLGEKMMYKKICSAVGKNFKLGISGGGALAKHLEDFFETIGINITVGYGLTETSPVLTLRRLDYNLRNTAGKPVSGTEIKIEEGVVYARGAQVMKGYYKNQKATDEILSEDGWLNTGDMGWLTEQNDLVLTGRSKDIIVLSNGENIEPQSLEDALLQSRFISQVMLVGQDKAHLGALIVPTAEAAVNRELHKILKKELKEHIQKRTNYRVFEKINCFRVVDEPFSVENGLLTRTMKVKKAEVAKKYNALIEEMFH